MSNRAMYMYVIVHCIYFKSQGPIVQWFQLIKAIIHNKKKRVCPRVRFMLQDVLELRENSWVPQVRDQEFKTIDQVMEDCSLCVHNLFW